MDAELFKLLECPRCAGPLRSANKALECRACQIDFPDLGGVPCLVPEPKKTIADWRRDAQRFAELIEEQVGTFEQELSRPDLLASTRKRLGRLRAAYRDNGERLMSLFRDAGVGPDSRAKASEREQSFVQYYEQALRDWAWEPQTGENRIAADLIAQTLAGDNDLGRVLVLGSGPSRLAYELHRRFAPSLTVCLDLDPLLLLIANRVLFGDGITLTEFALDARNIEAAAADHRLSAPDGRPERFYLVAGDAFAPPLHRGQFDTVVTPWFIDIVPADVRDTIGMIHRLLAPGGRWINYGPLSYPQEHRHGQRYAPEELAQLIHAGGFTRPALTTTVIDYMKSEANGRWKKLEVYTFAARKEDVGATTFSPGEGDAPTWLMFTHLPIPRLPGLDDYQPDHPLLGYLKGLIDGKRTLDDLIERVKEDHKPRPETAREGTRAMLALLVKALNDRG